MTPLAKTTLNPCPIVATPCPSPAESPKEKTAPPGQQLHGLGWTGGAPSQGDSPQPGAETPPQMFSREVDYLAKDPDFIKAGFHNGRFMTAVVNTGVERIEIQVLSE
jgi:hypothetical protein